MRSTILISLALAGLAGCSRFEPIGHEIEDSVLRVTTEPNVTLEVLEWGGTGPVLVFLAGGGHTAHQFDEFAPQFADGFRVLGITRRGIGASSDSTPRDLDDHVNDIAAVLDALDIGSAVLVGHSFAGMEMARFGNAHPDRCRGLIYLDSAYDYTDPALAELFAETPAPPGPPMTRADSASLDAVRAFNLRTQGFSVPDSEIRARRVFDDEGRMIGAAPNSAGVAPVPPRWESVSCPALGLYAVTAPLQEWWPYYASIYDSLTEEEREQGEAYVRAFAAWTATHREAFGRLPQNQVVEFPATGHYFFLEKPQEAAEAIREFVAGLQ